MVSLDPPRLSLPTQLISTENSLSPLLFPDTEIDWIAYMQEVTGYEQGERDYTNLKGDTGPLVYPAGFVHLFSWLKTLTRGGEIFPAQVVFALLYLATQLVVMGVYIDTKAIPPFALVLLTLSRRLHSIFVLRLFNDCWAMFLAYVGIWLLQRRRVAGAIFIFSVAVSIKMNVLLFAPGVLAVALKMSNILETCKGVTAGILFQFAVALPFIKEYPWEYMSRAFEFSRVFMYKWTVNWKCLPEEVFLSKQFALFLLLSHIRLLWMFASRDWFTEEGGVWNALKTFVEGKRDGENSKESRCKLSNQRIVSIVFMSNFLGILCARSLHYQFYSWYFHTIPFILLGNSVSLVYKLLVFVLIEVCWNIFPSNAFSSALLLVCHILMTCFAYMYGVTVKKVTVKIV
jgi:alpha-1,3-mannosyltransferase